VGGTEKIACTTGDVEIAMGAGESRYHGPLSWCFGAALGNSSRGTCWGELLSAMNREIRLHNLNLVYTFHGQPMGHFN